jgi:hypothetical protein
LLTEASDIEACNAGLQRLSYPLLDLDEQRKLEPSRGSSGTPVVPHAKLTDFGGRIPRQFPIIRSSRHGATHCHSIRYGIFSGHIDYLTDTRKTNDSINLWQIWISDCRADTRKSNVHNDLCQSLNLAVERGAVRARRSRVAINQMVRSRRNKMKRSMSTSCSSPDFTRWFARLPDDVAPVGSSERNAQFDKSEFGRGLKNADCGDHVSNREVKQHRA